MHALRWTRSASPGPSVQRRASSRSRSLGIVGGALGCWVVFYELSYSAESLAHALLPGLVGAALLGLPLRRSAARPACAVAAVAIALAAQVAGDRPRHRRSRSWSRRLFGLGVAARALADSPPGLSGPALRRRARRVATATSSLGRRLAAARSRALARAARGGCSPSASTAVSARGASACGPRVVDARAARARRGRAPRRRAGRSGTCSWSRCSSAPAATRAPAHAPDGADDGASQPRSRSPAAIAGLYLSYYADTAAGASVAAVLVAFFLLALVCVAKDGALRVRRGHPVRPAPAEVVRVVVDHVRPDRPRDPA